MSKPEPSGVLLGPQFVRPDLARYATRAENSRGRFCPEQESPTRSCYQRDRDRIIHSTAFRRLKHKTQPGHGPGRRHRRSRGPLT